MVFQVALRTTGNAEL